MPELTPYFGLFYGSGRKRIPEVELTRLVLAVWFMDDGSRSRSSVYLNTQQYDETSQALLLRLLREQWGIEGTLNRDKIYHRIRISVDGYEAARTARRPVSATRAQVQASANDPVTTEALEAEVASRPARTIYGRHNTPTPRLWSGRVEI